MMSLNVAGRSLVAKLRASVIMITWRDRIAWSLITASAMLGWPAIHLSAFVDEFDTLSVGAMMASGNVLYRDVFSHHYPLSYAWVAAIVSLFGRSFGAVRASIWLFTFGTIAVVASLTQRRLSVAVLAVVWSLVRIMYLGHEAMYTTWSALAIWVVFVLAVEAQTSRLRHEIAAGTVFGLAAAIAVMADPLCIYAIALGALALMSGSRRALAAAVAVGGVATLGVLGVLAYRAGLESFLAETVTFNQHYSIVYTGRSSHRLTEMLSTARHALLLTLPAWKRFDPFMSFSSEYGAFDAWAFTGMAYRGALLVASVSQLLARRPVFAVWIYAFGAALQANDFWGFRAAGLALVGLWIMASLVAGEWPRWTGGRIVHSCIRAVAAVNLAWLAVRTATFVYAPAQWQVRHEQYQADINSRDRLLRLACGKSDVELAAWPDGTSSYWYTGMRPVAGYLYLWPWVAETELPKVLDRLSDPSIKAIVVLHDTVVWDRWDTRVYLASLRTLLSQRYSNVGDDTWLSPALVESCGTG